MFGLEFADGNFDQFDSTKLILIKIKLMSM